MPRTTLRRPPAPAPVTPADRRAITSRQNLQPHIPEALSPEGSTSVGVRLPVPVMRRVEAAARRAGMTRTAWLRKVIVDAAQPGR